MATLASLPTRRAARGDIAHQRGLAATERLIAGELRGMGYSPRLQPLTWNLNRQAEFEARLESGGAAVQSRAAPETTPELAAKTWHNIIVEIPGGDLASEVLILGAHFDAVPGTPGADDNGTGTAALLEIARVLHGRPIRRTIRLVFFNLEEIGLKGSAEYVRTQKPAFDARAQTLIGMVSLEMLGFYSDAPNSQRSPIPRIEGVFDPPTVADFIGLATIKRHSAFCRRLEAEMSTAVPDLRIVVADFPPIAPPDFLRSDHAPFLLVGLPAVMLTDTSNFRNPNYHKPTDTIQTLDASRFTMVTRAVAAAAYAIAEPQPAQ